jgi:hypothetical protein
MGSVMAWFVGILAALLAFSALFSRLVDDAMDRGFDEDWTPTHEELMAAREHEKSQLIVSAMTRDRDAAFAAWTGTPFGEVPRVPPKESA